MLSKWALIIIFFSPDFSGYADFVGTMPTQEACEVAKSQVLPDLKRQFAGGHYTAECVLTKHTSQTGV